MSEIPPGWPEPVWLGRLGYGYTLERQRQHREAILEGRAPEAVWLLEHDPVVTTGRRAVALDPEQLGVPVVRTERGGLATYHGPGQLVGYLLIDVIRRGGGVRSTIAGVEQGVIDWLEGQGVRAGRRDAYPGVWVDGAKICAVGMHFRRGVSMHGFALNLAVDPSVWTGFDPCGIRDASVASLDRIAGRSLRPETVALAVGERIIDALARSFGSVDTRD